MSFAKSLRPGCLSIILILILLGMMINMCILSHKRNSGSRVGKFGW